jgi:hypothetical protein
LLRSATIVHRGIGVAGTRCLSGLLSGLVPDGGSAFAGRSASFAATLKRGTVCAKVPIDRSSLSRRGALRGLSSASLTTGGVGQSILVDPPDVDQVCSTEAWRNGKQTTLRVHVVQA